MADTTLRDRAAGAIMGAFIGDALGLGPHWYYDLAELRRDYGEWITGYTDPRPGRYHAGLKAGQSSQAGFILKLTLRSLIACGQYDEADFCRRMDEDLLPLLDGTVIDFIKQGLNEQFVFRNPNVAGECGCGESFTTDADKAA